MQKTGGAQRCSQKSVSSIILQGMVSKHETHGGIAEQDFHLQLSSASSQQLTQSLYLLANQGTAWV